MTLEQDFIRTIQGLNPQVDLRHDTFWDEDTRQILTTDLLVEEVHFDWRYFTPYELGCRAMAANLSDIAATGGIPKWALVDIAIPKDFKQEDLKQLYLGLSQSGVQIVGGDTSAAEKTFLAVTLIATLPEGATPGRRTGAIAGGVVAISGPHGLSRAGLEALRQDLPGFEQARRAHLCPTPPLALGQKIARTLDRYAMMDSSDGLADAVLRLAQASQVDIVIEQARLEIHPDVQHLDWVLYGGEDFELVVCLPADRLSEFPELTVIGKVQEGQGQAFLDGVPLSFEKTYQHFERLIL